MSTTHDTALRVRQMHIIWRDTFVVQKPPEDFLTSSRERLSNLVCYLSDSDVRPYRAQPESLRVIEQVSRNVARIGYPDLMRFQFAPLQLADLRPTLKRLRRRPDKLEISDVRDAIEQTDDASAWIGITPMLVLHRAGAGIMQYHATLQAPAPGFLPDQAIELARLGISTHLLRLPDAWRSDLPANFVSGVQSGILQAGPDAYVMPGGLRDLSQKVIAASLEATARTRRRGRRLRKRAARHTAETPRPTGSTAVILVETDPQPGEDMADFVTQYAYPLRGIGALDSYYRERADRIVRRELTDNLSADNEMAVYLLGNSELLLYNSQLDSVLPEVRTRLHTQSDYHATTYLSMHYGVLLEWSYLEEALLRKYIQRLDALAGSPTPRRAEIIPTLQGALADLVQYQENITPYATRIEFLERTRSYHKLDELAARFESKQELLLSYTSEFHDYREARATQYLNWLAGVLTGAALAELIITLAGITPQQPSLYLGITLGTVVAVLIVLAALLRFL